MLQCRIDSLGLASQAAGTQIYIAQHPFTVAFTKHSKSIWKGGYIMRTNQDEKESTCERMPMRGLSVLFEGTCKNVSVSVSACTAFQYLGGSVIIV